MLSFFYNYAFESKKLFCRDIASVVVSNFRLKLSRQLTENARCRAPPSLHHIVSMEDIMLFTMLLLHISIFERVVDQLRIA